MRALRWHGRGDVRLDHVAEPPPPAPGQVQIEVLACGICGTDVAEFLSGPHFVATEPHALTGRCAPLTLGHEFAGRVVAVGPDVDRLAAGDLVAIAPDLSCGACAWCTSGRPNLCRQLASLGLAGDGGLTERCNVPAALAVALPEHVSAEDGALVETLAVAFAALRRGRATAHDRVAVVGGGAVGLLTLQAAIALGAEEVGLVEPRAARAELGRKFGACVIDCADVARWDADVVIECSGGAGALEASIALAAPGGRIVVVGIHEQPREIDAAAIVERELELLGSLSYVFDPDYVRAAEMIATGAVDAAALITTRVPLSNALAGGLLALVERPEEHLKIVIVPDGGATR